MKLMHLLFNSRKHEETKEEEKRQREYERKQLDEVRDRVYQLTRRAEALDRRQRPREIVE